MSKRTCVNGHVITDRKATRCPDCGAEIAPAPRRKRKLLIIAMITLFALCGLVAIISTGGDRDGTVAQPIATVAATINTEQPATADAEPTATPRPSAEPTKAPGLGVLVQEDDAFLMALQVEDPAPATMFYAESEGTKLVAVEIIVGNAGDDVLSSNPLYATLIDDEGYTYSVSLAAREDQLATADLHSGEKVRGWVAFDVPESATPARVKYTPGLFSSTQLVTSLDSGTAADGLGSVPTGGLTEVGPLGEVNEGYGCTLVATAVEDPAAGGMLYSPKAGRKLVAVDVVLANVNKEKLDVNPLYALLVDREGYVYSPELAGRDGQIDALDLAVAEKARGWIAFAVPDGAVPHSIKYNVDLFSEHYLRAGLGK